MIAKEKKLDIIRNEQNIHFNSHTYILMHILNTDSNNLYEHVWIVWNKNENVRISLQVLNKAKIVKLFNWFII